MTVGSDYDPMLAKVIAHGQDRGEALRRLDDALAHTAVLGVGTNIDFLRFVLADDDVAAGRLDTALLEGLDYTAPVADDDVLIAAAAYRWLRAWPSAALRAATMARRRSTSSRAA
jgi:acetyl-CoA/propionyl-CoA carboxylase biotin carboxyl carrier protein